MSVPRCCKDSLAIELAKLEAPPVEGQEIPCRWCADLWRFECGDWRRHDELRERIDRMKAVIESDDYRRERERVLGRPAR